MSGEAQGSTRRVGIVVHPSRVSAHELAGRVRTWWEAHGYTVVDGPPALDSAGPAAFASPVDFAISLGGDGTMLRTVQAVAADKVPVLGVNLGNLGYLTGVEPNAVEAAFERMVRGEYELEERMMLELALVSADGSVSPTMLAMNEAVVEKTAPGHTIRVHAVISKRPFLTYVADGMVVSTPTGTTAYNLSVRGPIVSPLLRAVVLTPISPHMLFDRSLVLEPEEPVELELLEGRPAVLVVDGITVGKLSAHDRVRIVAAAEPARFVRIESTDFHAILRAKFGLTDR